MPGASSSVRAWLPSERPKRTAASSSQRPARGSAALSRALPDAPAARAAAPPGTRGTRAGRRAARGARRSGVTAKASPASRPSGQRRVTCTVRTASRRGGSPATSRRRAGWRGGLVAERLQHDRGQPQQQRVARDSPSDGRCPGRDRWPGTRPCPRSPGRAAACARRGAAPRRQRRRRAGAGARRPRIAAAAASPPQGHPPVDAPGVDGDRERHEPDAQRTRPRAARCPA